MSAAITAADKLNEDKLCYLEAKDCGLVTANDIDSVPESAEVV